MMSRQILSRYPWRRSAGQYYRGGFPGVSDKRLIQPNFSLHFFNISLVSMAGFTSYWTHFTGNQGFFRQYPQGQYCWAHGSEYLMTILYCLYLKVIHVLMKKDTESLGQRIILLLARRTNGDNFSQSQSIIGLRVVHTAWVHIAFASAKIGTLLFPQKKYRWSKQPINNVIGRCKDY